MSKLKKIVKSYLIFLLFLLLNALQLGREVSFLFIQPVFLLLGLMDVWVQKETIMKFMGNDAKIKGGIFAFFRFVFVRPVICFISCRNGFSKKGSFSDQYLHFSRCLVNNKNSDDAI